MKSPADVVSIKSSDEEFGFGTALKPGVLYRLMCNFFSHLAQQKKGEFEKVTQEYGYVPSRFSIMRLAEQDIIIALPSGDAENDGVATTKHHCLSLAGTVEIIASHIKDNQLALRNPTFYFPVALTQFNRNHYVLVVVYKGEFQLIDSIWMGYSDNKIYTTIRSGLKPIYDVKIQLEAIHRKKCQRFSHKWPCGYYVFLEMIRHYQKNHHPCVNIDIPESNFRITRKMVDFIAAYYNNDGYNQLHKPLDTARLLAEFYIFEPPPEPQFVQGGKSTYTALEDSDSDTGGDLKYVVQLTAQVKACDFENTPEQLLTKKWLLEFAIPLLELMSSETDETYIPLNKIGQPELVFPDSEAAQTLQATLKLHALNIETTPPSFSS